MNNMNIMKTLLLAGLFALGLALPSAHGEESWRTDFDETCAKTDVAMSLSVSELNALIEKCNRLEKVIDAQDETVRKVYRKRLEMCKNLYLFVVGEKNKEQQTK
jgi:hypothetical protein